MLFPPFTPHLINAGIHQYDRQWTWSTFDPPLGWHGYILGSILGGRGQLDHNGDCLALVRGSVYLLWLEGEAYAFHSVSDEPLVVAWIHMDWPQRPDVLPPLHQIVDEPIFWEQLIHRTIEACFGRDSQTADYWLQVCFVELQSQKHRLAAPGAVDVPYASQIQELCRDIRTHPGQNWTLATMSNRVGVSTSHFVRLFRRYQELSPTAFVIACRIEAARSYLRTTNWPIARIAFLLGYYDQFAFSRQFRQNSGLSPQEFRGKTQSKALIKLPQNK